MPAPDDTAGSAGLPLEITQDGAVATLWLNRPAVRNALDADVCERLIAALHRLDADPAVRLILLRGRGPGFCSGPDTREIDRRKADERWYLWRRNLGIDAYRAIEHCGTPVVAVVHGAAVGGGCELVLAADFALAADDARFRWPEARRGIGATQRLPRRVGLAMARDLLFTCRTIDAAEALRLGIVTRMVARARLDAAVTGLVDELLGSHPEALRLIRRAIRDGMPLTLDQAIDYERGLIAGHLAVPRSIGPG